ncbi:MAG: CBS domain-containing protein [Halioglobus sp.]|jgi:CBS domain-containing protein
MTTVETLLKSKGTNIWSIAPQATVYEALQKMKTKDTGALLVVEATKMVGIFTERDYARKLVLQGKFSRETAVSELMTRDVLTVTPMNTVQDCMVMMTAKRVRHLPVLDGEQLMGIVSIGDVVKQVISEQASAIKQLEQYIGGGY